MPSIQVFFPSDNLPTEFECQIRAYIRFLWHDSYVYDLDEPLVRSVRHPHFVVMSERHALMSAARVTWVMMNHAGQTYKIYCLGDVFTYPAFRKRGYGHQVVAQATQIIRDDEEADVAILFTDQSLEDFYGQCGWEHVQGFSGTLGEPDAPEKAHDFAMMLFLSEKGKQTRQRFASEPVYLPGYGW